MSLFFPPATSFYPGLQTNSGTVIGSIFAPILEKGGLNQCIGHYAQAGAGPPSGFVLTAMLASQGDPDAATLALPTGFTLVWQDPATNVTFPQGQAPQNTVSIWAPAAPVGFVALGMVGRQEAYVGAGNSATAPPTTTLRCIRSDKVQSTAPGPLIFFYGRGPTPVWVYSIAQTGLFWASTGAAPSQVWIPQPSDGLGARQMPFMKRRR